MSLHHSLSTAAPSRAHGGPDLGCPSAPPDAADVAAGIGTPAADACYLYAVVPARAAAPGGAAILPAASVELVRAGRVAALVSPVPRAWFDAGAPDAADPGWMDARALAHHDVVAAACAAGPCLPFAFGALFTGPASVADWLHSREAGLAAALGQVTDTAEWVLALQEDAAASQAWLARQDPDLGGMAAAADTASPATGALLHRRLDRLRAGAGAARRGVLGARIATVLDRHAEMVAGRAPRWTALVRHDLLAPLREDLGAMAAETAGTGIELVLTGPWPPYGFARETVLPAGIGPALAPLAPAQSLPAPSLLAQSLRTPSLPAPVPPVPSALARDPGLRGRMR